MTNRLFCQRRNPKPFDRFISSQAFIDPALNQLPFLPGIPAVDDFRSIAIERLKDFELLANMSGLDQLGFVLCWQIAKKTFGASMTGYVKWLVRKWIKVKVVMFP